MAAIRPSRQTRRVVCPETERHERGRKWEHYRRLPSLAELLLVAQDEPRIEHYLRQQGGLWLLD